MSFEPITDLPPAPDATDVGQAFNDKAILLMAALQPWIDEMNLFGQAANDFMTAAFTATSTSSVAIGPGTKNFTASTGAAFVGGQRVVIASDADPANDYMLATVTSYDRVTGALTVEVAALDAYGAGTHTDWSIGLTIPADLTGYLQLAGGVMTGPLNIEASSAIFTLKDTDSPGSTAVAYAIMRDSADASMGWFGFNGDGNFNIQCNTGGAVTINASVAWHAGNDGAGSGLDADLLDGQQGSYYLAAGTYTAADVLAKLVTVDGSGSGLDADLLDGQHGSYYAPKASPALTGTPTAPTPSVGDSTTKLATTAFVGAEISNALNASGSAPMFAARAWCCFNGVGTVSIKASGNISSVTDSGTGAYTINLTTALEDADYTYAGFAMDTDSSGDAWLGRPVSGTKTTSAFRFNNSNAGGTSFDSSDIAIVLHR